ncbi:hypothetical protein SAMN04488505_1011434 [Chitinophaga rupis]|uniref:Uncharacterized protein n=1 Tax=Chitinophaga rupis TaxID=573321 RepID=A0A1H7M9T1_9BACT|nr:hypothetical protein [Chitinophaga rupis]SEL07495.1 hypothetical protein SAMN04488505_1011434 [Chitinophaga rupis]
MQQNWWWQRNTPCRKILTGTIVLKDHITLQLQNVEGASIKKVHAKGAAKELISYGWIQLHQRCATGLLLDGCNVPDGGIDLMNRGAMGSGHGWAIGWAVVWNCKAQLFLNQQPPGAANWVIGNQGERQKPNPDLALMLKRRQEEKYTNTVVIYNEGTGEAVDPFFEEKGDAQKFLFGAHLNARYSVAHNLEVMLGGQYFFNSLYKSENTFKPFHDKSKVLQVQLGLSYDLGRLSENYSFRGSYEALFIHPSGSNLKNFEL